MDSEQLRQTKLEATNAGSYQQRRYARRILRELREQGVSPEHARLPTGLAFRSPEQAKGYGHV